jgi:hypothetical protein
MDEPLTPIKVNNCIIFATNKKIKPLIPVYLGLDLGFNPFN